MTVQELSEKYGMSEAQLYEYAASRFRSFRKNEENGEPPMFTGQTLRQLDWLLAIDREQRKEAVEKEEFIPKVADDKNDDWEHDPTEDEPDDSEVPPPMVEPEKSEMEPTKPTENELKEEENKKPHTISELAEKAWEKEKCEMAARMEKMQQELASLRHTNLKMQSSTAEKQAELLAKAVQERQLAEERIALMKQDTASFKHLSNVRIRELEGRNADLEEQVKTTQNELTDVSAELITAQRVIQEIKDHANQQGAEQKLQLLNAQHRQDELYKIIHEKEIKLTEEKEKFQELMEKYNGALMRMGEMIGKIEKARTRMQEISAEFDAYIKDDAGSEYKEIEKAPQNPVEEITGKKPEQLASPPEQKPEQMPVPNPETLEVLGKPLHEIYPKQSPLKEQASAKPPTLWRKIASFF